MLLLYITMFFIVVILLWVVSNGSREAAMVENYNYMSCVGCVIVVFKIFIMIILGLALAWLTYKILGY